MIKVAFLEHEAQTKEIVFVLAKYFASVDWTFRHFYKASLLAKAMKEEPYQIFFLDEMFHTPRLDGVFIHDNPSSLMVYLCEHPEQYAQKETRSRVLFLSKENLREELDKIRNTLTAQAAQKDVYALTYQGIRIDLPIEDIFYIEKIGKNVYFHTRKGEFHRRLNLADLEAHFEPYGFLRTHISYLINAKYMTGIFKDEVELNHSIRVPLSRAQKKKLNLKVRQTGS